MKQKECISAHCIVYQKKELFCANISVLKVNQALIQPKKRKNISSFRGILTCMDSPGSLEAYLIIIQYCKSILVFTQEVFAHFIYIVTYYIKRVNTSWTYSTAVRQVSLEGQELLQARDRESNLRAEIHRIQVQNNIRK